MGGNAPWSIVQAVSGVALQSADVIDVPKHVVDLLAYFSVCRVGFVN